MSQQLLRVYFDRVDGKWRVKGYEHLTFTTEEDADNACDLAIEWAPDMVAAMTGNSVHIDPNTGAPK